MPILRHYLDDESVDLIYLDPPFNSNRSYNVLFRDESGPEIADLFNGAQVQMPPWAITFKQAERAKAERTGQAGLFEERQ